MKETRNLKNLEICNRKKHQRSLHNQIESQSGLGLNALSYTLYSEQNYLQFLKGYCNIYLIG